MTHQGFIVGYITLANLVEGVSHISVGGGSDTLVESIYFSFNPTSVHFIMLLGLLFLSFSLSHRDITRDERVICISTHNDYL